MADVGPGPTQGAQPGSAPDWEPELRKRLAGLSADPSRVDDIVQELAQHLDDRYRELLEAGGPDHEAKRVALEELAAPHVLGRALRPLERPPAARAPAMGRPIAEGWVFGVWSDVRDGVRALRGSPVLTTVALLTLSIGIGANVAIFSVVNAAILRPLPFADPDRIVSFWGSAPQMGLPVVNYPDALLVYTRERSRTLTPIAGYSTSGFTLTGAGEAERLDGAIVTADFFPLLGRMPAQGRAFLAEEERNGRHQVAVLGDGLWRRRFGGSPDILGKTITLDGTPITVVGIMPPGFDFPNHAQLWMPLVINPQSLNCWCYGTLGRLAPGQTPESAAREMAWIMDDFWRERESKPARDPNSTEAPTSLVLAAPLARELLGDVKTPLLVMLAAVGMVLLIACANIANLLLARAGARTREIALRCCLGASPWRIVRQLLVESLLLGLAGAAVGLMIASWGARVLGQLAMERLTYLRGVRLDPTVFAFAIAVTLVTVVLFGVAPALRGARIDLQDAVKDGWRSTRTAASRRLTDAFVVAQFALSIVLLIGAGLLLRSLSQLLDVDPGFRPANVLVGRVTLSFVGVPSDQHASRSRLFYTQLAERVRALPGVQAVGLSSTAPFSAGNNQQIFTIKGREPAEGQPKLVASVRTVTSGYFGAIGTPLRRGRSFEESDSDNAPLVAIVDETLAQRFWPDGDAVGHEVKLGDDGPWRRIIAVAASIKHGDLSERSDRYVYLPYAQMSYGRMDLVVRAHVEPAALTTAVRGAIQSLDGTLPFYEVHTLDEALARSVATRRLTNNLLLAFALAALILAAVGIYGVMSLNVNQRVHEFGIRVALGARPRDVMSLVLNRGMRLVVFGVLLGLAGAVSLTRYLESLLFQVKPTDPWIFGGVAVVLVAVAIAACFIPARRATATPPLEALRSH
jgi:putative ABC transport system permease protein